jgi:hypothetical protein
MQASSRNLLEVNLWISHYGRWLPGATRPAALPLLEGARLWPHGQTCPAD